MARSGENTAITLLTSSATFSLTNTNFIKIYLEKDIKRERSLRNVTMR